MPSSVIVHAAVFTAGALLGGGVAAAVTSRKRPVPPPNAPLHAPVTTQIKTGAPVIDIDSTGRTKISTELTVTSILPPALKYGNPGM